MKRINSIYLKGCCDTKVKHKQIKDELNIDSEENFDGVCDSDEDPRKEDLHKLDERDKDLMIEQEFKGMLQRRGYLKYLSHYVYQMNKSRLIF